MSEFRTRLVEELVCPWCNDGTGQWQFVEELHYYSTRLRQLVVVPKGFSYDRASVPRMPVAYALFGGRYSRSAGVHDFLCRMRRVRRETADLVFLEAMRVENAEEIAALQFAGEDNDTIAERKSVLEGRALTMYAGVAAHTKTGLWKSDVDRPGFEPIG